MRFESASNAFSQISNSALHHGLGRGTEITSSSNIVIVNTTYFNFIKFSIDIGLSRNITIDGNILVGTNARHLNNSVMGD